MTAAPAKTRSGASAPGRVAGETHVTSRLEAPPAARAATGATAPNAHDVFVAASPLLSSFSSPGEARGTTARPRTPSTAPPTVTVTETPPDAPPRRGACASTHGVGAAATRAAASSPAARSPSGASASAASPPPTPSSAASGGVSHVASAPETTRAGARADAVEAPELPEDEKTHRSGGDAATPNEPSPDGDSKNASPESVATAPPSAPVTPAATRETRGGASRAKTTACAVTPPRAEPLEPLDPATRTATKTASAAWDASRTDDGAHATRDAKANETVAPSRASRRSRAVLRFSPQAAASSHAPTTSSRSADARTAAEGTTARISAAETTDKTSADVVQLETSREDSAKPIPEPATTRRAPGLEAGETHVVAAKRAPASASRGAPTSGPIVPTRHADAGVATPGSPADAEKARVTTSPVPPSSAASRGAKVTARGASWYANGADSATEGSSRSRSKPRSAPRVSPRKALASLAANGERVAEVSRTGCSRGCGGVSTSTSREETKDATGTTTSPKATNGPRFSPDTHARVPPPRGAAAGAAARTAARSMRSHSGPRASRASREAASASSTYSRTTVRLPCAS